MVKKEKKMLSLGGPTLKKLTFNKVMPLITLVCNSMTSRYKGHERPRVRVTKDNKEQSFLDDTGAQWSCMPFNRIFGPAKLRKLPEKELHIRDAGGNNLGYKEHI